MNTIESIKSRSSIRDFIDKEIPKDILDEIVKMGLYAPSGGNRSKFRYFLIINDKEKINKIGRLAPCSNFIIDKVSTLIVTLCDKKNTFTPVEDGCAATQNILLAANHFGISSCWIRGYGTYYTTEVEKDILNLPNDIMLISMIALGYSNKKHIKKDVSNIENNIIFNNFKSSF